jgi:predicted dithiol-disulfide oxidoreductase (DUF899 family)
LTRPTPKIPHGLALSLGVLRRKPLQFDFNVSFTPEQRAHGSAFYNFTDMKIGPDTDEMPGLSAFFKDETGAISHTYSAYARGLEEAVGTLMLLDRAPKGRNETTTMDFVRRHDEYETGPPS